jgi:hypothetical protein
MADRELRVVIRAKDEATSVFKGIGDVAKTAIGVAIGSVVVPALKAMAGQLGSVFEEAMLYEDMQARLNAVLQSTGGVAGMTLVKLNELAVGWSQVTRYGEEAVMGAEAMILRFTNIGQEVFPQVLEAALNMSTALGQDLNSSVTMLGRALQDPVAGMTALQRIGVRLTEDQQEQIKVLAASGKTMEAQGIILGELRKQFDGAAVAAGKTFGGQLAILKNNIGELKEGIGLQLTPALAGLIGEFNQFVLTVTPAVSTAVGIIWRAFTGVTGSAEGWGANLGTSFANGLLAAVPYIVGVIRAIGRIIRYWFAPGSPPKIAEDIDEWGKALVQEYFKAFSAADLSPIISFSNELGSLFQDALSYNLISEDQAAAMLAPLKAQFASVFAEFGRTGGVASFAGLKAAAGPLGAQVERIARQFLGLKEAAAGAGAGGTAGDTASTADDLAKTEDAATGTAAALAGAQAALDELLAGAGAAGSGLSAAFDPAGISGKADEIADSIVNTILPAMEGFTIDVTGWVDDIATAVKDGDWTAVGAAIVKAIGDLAFDLSTVGLSLAEDFQSWANSNGEDAFKDAGEALGKALVGAVKGFFDTGDSKTTSEPVLLAVIRNLVNGVKAVTLGVANLALTFVGSIWTELTVALFGEKSRGDAEISVSALLNTLQKAFDTKLSLAEWIKPGALLAILFSGDEWKKIGDRITTNIDTKVVQPIKDFLGIHSPSVVFTEIGKSCMDGLEAGISESLQTVKDTLAGVLSAAVYYGLGGWITDASKAGGILFNRGVDIVNGMIDGIRARMGKVADELTPSASATSDGGGGGGGGSGMDGGSASSSKSKGKLKGKAGGGWVFGGNPYLVGEQGPELFVPRQSGNIMPNNQVAGTTWNVTINTAQSGTRVVDDIRYLQMLGAMA